MITYSCLILFLMCNIAYGFVFDLSYLYKDMKNNPSAMFPGTKWCGSGNVAENYEDLGHELETDKCCRAHDNCDDYILAGETKYNLTNEAFFTRVACKCDEDFQQCLKDTNTDASNTVGMTYFNALGTKCFRKAYPVLDCKTYDTVFVEYCLEYEYDSSGEEIYQWFDVKAYSNSRVPSL